MLFFTLLPGGEGEGRIGTATMFRKMLLKYVIFSTVIVQDCSQTLIRI